MKKILLIKLGDIGDVIRTIPIAKAIKDKYLCKLFWLTSQDAKEIIENQEFIDEVITSPPSLEDTFDILINLDINLEALKLSSKLKSSEKFGFYDDSGYPSAFTLDAEYFLNTFFNNDLKKTNEKTYQEMMFLASELPFTREKYFLKINEKSEIFAEYFSRRNYLHSNKLIGISLNYSNDKPSASWHNKNILKFIKLAKKEGYEILLLGRPEDSEKYNDLKQLIAKESITVYKNDFQDSFQNFMAIINLCKYIITGDSISLHISLGLNKKTIGLFFVTSPKEIEGYGLLKKLKSPNLDEFFPEKTSQYNEELAKSISSEEVLKSIHEFEKEND